MTKGKKRRGERELRVATGVGECVGLEVEGRAWGSSPDVGMCSMGTVDSQVVTSDRFKSVRFLMLAAVCHFIPLFVLAYVFGDEIIRWSGEVDVVGWSAGLVRASGLFG